MLIQHVPLLCAKRIVLASASPRRSELLRGLGLKVEVIPSTFEENLDKSGFANPGEYATETATYKAIDVSQNAAKANFGRRADLIIAADTVVELHVLSTPLNTFFSIRLGLGLQLCSAEKVKCSAGFGEVQSQVLEKPFDKDDAYRMLSSLSGQKHKVYTGVALVLPNASDPVLGATPLVKSFYEETEVEFAELEEEAILAYIASGEPMDKAGAYGIQGIGGSFVKCIHGCYFNIMGFPVHRFSVEVDRLVKSGAIKA